MEQERNIVQLEPATLRLAKAARRVADLAHALHFGQLSDPARVNHALVTFDREAASYREDGV